MLEPEESHSIDGQQWWVDLTDVFKSVSAAMLSCLKIAHGFTKTVLDCQNFLRAEQYPI